MSLADWFFAAAIACGILGGLMLIAYLWHERGPSEVEKQRLYWREEINATIELFNEGVVVLNDKEYLHECIEQYRSYC